ncbi:helix-turn-helix domain-containing protein [Novosphingobium sediminicola]|uniref:AraC-like DNA-binding protein n=1 Tax=Novosphingobium sediminicola TaxID=563162 RepID=A0A7W6CPE7_9SPHN|nr:helix-turn-helix domain-containing protein [Novosphingobium sediminicola]MBB3957530.1 AraC-like DNA-binding protein [Novosphingobium sediminicola]
MLIKHATGSVCANERLDYWNDLIAAMFPGMTVDGARDIDASWTGCRLGDFGLSLALSQRSSVRRWAGSAPQSVGERGLIHFQSKGFSATEQCGRHAALFSGDLTFCAPEEPYGIEISDRNAMFVIDFPWEALREFGARPGMILRHRTPSLGVLRGFIASIFAQSWSDTHTPAESEALGEVLMRLLANAMRTRESRPEAGADLRERVLAFVEDNLANGALRTGSIAQSLGVPAREVQMVFAEMATTASDYINTRRLALAADRLRKGTRGASLSDLAYELGFSDAAHFSRRFRERFGETPSFYATRFRG